MTVSPDTESVQTRLQPLAPDGAHWGELPAVPDPPLAGHRNRYSPPLSWSVAVTNPGISALFRRCRQTTDKRRPGVCRKVKSISVPGSSCRIPMRLWRNRAVRRRGPLKHPPRHIGIRTLLGCVGVAEKHPGGMNDISPASNSPLGRPLSLGHQPSRNGALKIANVLGIVPLKLTLNCQSHTCHLTAL